MCLNKLLKALWGVQWPTATKNVFSYNTKGEEDDGTVFFIFRISICKILNVERMNVLVNM